MSSHRPTLDHKEVLIEGEIRPERERYFSIEPGGSSQFPNANINDEHAHEVYRHSPADPSNVKDGNKIGHVHLVEYQAPDQKATHDKEHVNGYPSSHEDSESMLHLTKV